MLLLIRGHRDYEMFVFILENITDANFKWAQIQNKRKIDIYDNVYAHNMLLFIFSVVGRKTLFIFLMSADIFWYAYLIESLINYPIKEKNKTLRYVTMAWSMFLETFSRLSLLKPGGMSSENELITLIYLHKLTHYVFPI